MTRDAFGCQHNTSESHLVRGSLNTYRVVRHLVHVADSEQLPPHSETMASIAVPLLYILIVFGGLWAFSSIYRRRALSKCNPNFTQ